MGILHIKNISRYRPFVWRPIAINQKKKKKLKKEKKRKTENKKENKKNSKEQ